jgi:hypothetical protein
MFKEGLTYTFFLSTPSFDGVDTAMVRRRYEGNPCLLPGMPIN